jgi:hypothetical protein
VVWQDQSIKTSVIHGSGSEEAVRSLRTVFKKSLNGDIDTEEVASAYAPAFIAASPAGVMCGKNDEQLMHVMRQGYAHYRAIGTKDRKRTVSSGAPQPCRVLRAGCEYGMSALRR